MKIEDIKDRLEKAKVFVATINSENKPHGIAIMYANVKDKKIIITDNYMRTTVENLKKDPSICLVFLDGEKGWRVSGEAEYHNSGKYLDFVKSLPENKAHPAKGAIVIDIKEIRGLG